MLTYCVKQRKKIQCVSGSETYLVTKNGRPAMKCKCAECGITKFKFLSQKEMNKKSGSGTSPIVQLMDKVNGASETRKVLGTIIPAIIKEKGAKESFDDFAIGKTFKSAWRGIGRSEIHQGTGAS